MAVSIHQNPGRLKVLLKLLTTLAPIKVDILPVATTFTRFPELPQEIRDKIWGFAAHVPRHVRFYSLERYAGGLCEPDGCSHEKCEKALMRIDGQHYLPPMLHTCYDARREGLKYYDPFYEELPLYGEGEWNPDEDGNPMPDAHVPNPDDEAKNGFKMINKLYVNPAVDHFWWDWKSKACAGRYTRRDGFGFSLCQYSELLRSKMSNIAIWHDDSEDKCGRWKKTGLFDFQEVLFEKGSPLKHLTLIVENWDFWGFH